VAVPQSPFSFLPPQDSRDPTPARSCDAPLELLGCVTAASGSFRAQESARCATGMTRVSALAIPALYPRSTILGKTDDYQTSDRNYTYLLRGVDCVHDHHPQRSFP
jgi:hypothetical protein